MQGDEMFESGRINTYVPKEKKYKEIEISSLSPEKLKSLGVVPFTTTKLGCCGLRELYSTHSTIHYTEKNFLNWLEWEFCGDGNRAWIHAVWDNPKVPRGGLLIIALHNDDYYGKEKDLPQWLANRGFKKLTTFENRIHHSNKLVLWGFQLPKSLEEHAFIPIKKEALAVPNLNEELKKGVKQQCA